MRVAIHQPNFLPWIGFFDKWRKSDVLILLDDAQLPKKGGSWTNRCRIADTHNETQFWLSVPVQRPPSSTQAINRSLVDNSQMWARTAYNRLAASYASLPGGPVILEEVKVLFSHRYDLLVELNRAGLDALGRLLGLSFDRVVLASDMGIRTTGTERLRDLVKCVGGSEYLSGQGSSSYLEPNVLEDSGIRVVWQRLQGFSNTVSYPTPNTLGLSVVDLIARCGPLEARRVLENL